MSFQIALSALQAINTQLDSISNNIANTGTTGYKSSRTNFAAMYANESPTACRPRRPHRRWTSTVAC